MPLTIPTIDDRRYQQWVDELLARVPVYTPEWTNFNQSDPGVTLVQLFAHLTESLLYRANLIPERNRIRFLQLLGVPLAAASEARGLVTIDNLRAPLATLTLGADLEVRAGEVPFRTALGLEVLPVEARVFFKRPLAAPAAELTDYYRLLYASYRRELPLEPTLYETVALDPAVVDQVDLNADAVDRSLWIALLGRKADRGSGADPWKAVRDCLGGRTLTLGLVPALDAEAPLDPDTGRPQPLQLSLTPGGQSQPAESLVFELPRLTADRQVPRDANDRPVPGYRQLAPRTDTDLLATPGVVQLALPTAAELDTWRDLDPLESGVGDLPPNLDDSGLSERLITWLRVRALGAARARLLWVGINAVPVRQLEWVSAEPLAPGDGTPGQVRRLARAPVLAGSIQVLTQESAGPRVWTAIDDLLAAEPEVPVPDPRAAPGAAVGPAWTDPDEIRRRTDCFAADHEAGILTFGDGLRGRRPTAGAALYARYAFCQGAAGNLSARAIDSAPQLPAGLAVTNPVQTWGGADAESPADGEKQIKRWLQHRDRLVSADDFAAIAWRTPGIEIGRIEVLPAFHPALSPMEPGVAPGVVTLLAIPRRDPGQPDAPRADRLFLNSLCRYLEPRRLVTTELIVRGPDYRGVWISVGIEVAAGYAVAEVVDAVKQRLRAFLAPIPAAGQGGFRPQTEPLFGTDPVAVAQGWPLRTAVRARVLLAEAARVAGVTAVADCLVAEGTGPERPEIPMNGLDLPRILGLSVVTGEPVSMAALRGDGSANGSGSGSGTGSGTATAAALLPVPVVPDTCR